MSAWERVLMMQLKEMRHTGQLDSFLLQLWMHFMQNTWFWKTKKGINTTAINLTTKQ